MGAGRDRRRRSSRGRGALAAAALAGLVLLLAGSGAPGTGGSALPDAEPPGDPDPEQAVPRCGSAGTAGPTTADSSLYCMELVPHPDVRDASGAATLQFAPGPFILPVTADGRLRYRIALELSGLPPADSLGPYRTYVAWALPPSMAPVRKLGEVGDGRRVVGPVAMDRFLLLVTAEPSADVATRSGPPVLRGLSPGMQMSDVHFMGPGRERGDAPRGPGELERPGEVEGPEELDDPGAAREPGAPLRWPPPPMNPRTSPMAMPGLEEAVPTADPYLPGAGADADSLPTAAPRRPVEVAHGDTIRLVAGPVRHELAGREVIQLAYNGQIPGPLIRVREGATIYAEFVNRTEFPGTIHWHGIRIQNPFDGVPGVTQEPVESGDRFLYRIRFPDAGLYWYHPHHREDVLQDLGLYGNLMVSPRDSAHYAPAHRDEVLVLDDVLLGEAGLVPWGRGRATHAVMGRFGNRLLVNGRTGYDLEVRRGAVVRFHLTNVSNVRTFNLSFGGAPMKLVATDVGRFQREERVESVVLAPAERYVVDVRFPEGGRYALVNRFHAVDHGADRFFAASDTLGVVRVGRERARPGPADAFARSREPDSVGPVLERMRSRAGDVARKELVLTLEDTGLPFTLQGLMGQESRGYVHPLEWTGTMPRMSWLPTTDEARWILREPSTGRENREIEWRFRVGDVVRIRIHNDRRSLHPMQHPIHIHGQRFLILAVNGVPKENLAWKDTALIPVGATVDLLLELSNPGEWMLHCHVSEHLEAGMKMTFTVEGEDPLASGTAAPVE